MRKRWEWSAQKKCFGAFSATRQGNQSLCELTETTRQSENSAASSKRPYLTNAAEMALRRKACVRTSVSRRLSVAQCCGVDVLLEMTKLQTNNLLRASQEERHFGHAG